MRAIQARPVLLADACVLCVPLVAARTLAHRRKTLSVDAAPFQRATRTGANMRS
jgi:hypothetical protein